MIKSMTGFAKTEAEWPEGKISGEARSLNSRYLELSVKLPKMDYAQEQRVRDLVKRYVSRGKVDLNIKFERAVGSWSAPKVNEETIGHYVELVQSIRDRYNLEGNPRIDEILGFRDIITYEENNSLPEEGLAGVVEALLKELDGVRSGEGEMIGRDLEGRISQIRLWVGEIDGRRPVAFANHEERLREKIGEVVRSGSVDEGRILQEMVVFMERLDISEEIVRLKGHMDLFSETLKAVEPVGRKLDFIIQEMVRETNTIGSKANDLFISERVIKIKVEIEKIREQVQNVE